MAVLVRRDALQVRATAGQAAGAVVNGEPAGFGIITYFNEDLTASGGTSTSPSGYFAITNQPFETSWTATAAGFVTASPGYMSGILPNHVTVVVIRMVADE